MNSSHDDKKQKNKKKKIFTGKRIVGILTLSVTIQIVLFQVKNQRQLETNIMDYGTNGRITAAAAAAAAATTTNVLDDNDAQILMKSGCYVVHDLCYSSSSSSSSFINNNNNKQRHFFYRTSMSENNNNNYNNSTANTTSPRRNPLLFQPKLIVMKETRRLKAKWTVKAPPPQYNKNININNNNTILMSSSSCDTSPIPNHFILHSDLIHMMMEFYIRLVAGLYRIIQTIPWWLSSEQQQSQSSSSSSLSSSSPDIQFYLDWPQLSSSHPVFLAPFSQHPVKILDDLLFVNEEEKETAAATTTTTTTENSKLNQSDHNDISSPSTTSSCTCLQRVVFCGYGHVKDEEEEEKAKQQQQEKKQQHQQEEEVTQYHDHNHPHSYDSYYLNLEHKSIIGLEPINFGYFPSRQFWQTLRTQIRHTMVDENSLVQEGIQRLKDSIIGSSSRIDDEAVSLSSQPSSSQPTLLLPVKNNNKKKNDWKFVGFSQRLYRRRWLNLPDLIEHCNTLWNNTQYRLTCLEVNMDLPQSQSNPIQQVIVHGGLSAMIGIHGSQQAHAVWMPPHSYQLELLPYLIGKFEGRGGQWTQDTHMPTMNGFMLQDTDINHLGYPLDYKSVPNCTAILSTQKKGGNPNPIGGDDGTSNRACIKTGSWANRDFVVEWKIIEQFIQEYLLGPVPQTCNEFEAKSMEDFVLYNVGCSMNVSDPMTLMTINATDSVYYNTSKKNTIGFASVVDYHEDDEDSPLEDDHHHRWVYRQFFRERASFQHLRLQAELFPNDTLHTLRKPVNQLQNMEIKRKRRWWSIQSQNLAHPQLQHWNE